MSLCAPPTLLLRIGCLASLLAIGLTGCEGKNRFVPPPPPEVTVAIPTVREVVDTVEFTGTTRATARVELRARVGGYLERIEFQDGQMVQQGDLLFVIDQAPFEVEVQSAQAALQKAEASLQLAAANLARTEKLVRSNVATEEELDVRRAEHASTSADVAAARAALDQAELNLNYTEIRAPISGRIGRHLADVGALIQAQQTQLTIIESIDPIHAYFYISEREILRFMQMLRSKELPDPEANPPALYLGLASEEGFPHEGKLDFREFGVDPGTGTVERRGVFPNPNHILIPGLFVRIQAQVGEPKPRLLVDERAIGSDQRGDYVLVVTADDTVEYRPVELGISVDGQRVIQQGLEENEQIVVNGLQRARPGAKVSPLRQTETAASDADPDPPRTARRAGPAENQHSD